MKHLIGIALIALCAAGSAQAPDLSKMDLVEKSVPAGGVGMVDGDMISAEEFLTVYRQQLLKLAAMAGGDKITERIRLETGIQVIRELVRERILLSEAKRRGLSVSDADAMAEYNKQFADLQAEVLKNSGKTLTEADFLKEIGKTREEVMADAKQTMLLMKAREALLEGSNTDIPDADIKKFYDKNKDQFGRPGGISLKQVFVRPEGGETAGPKAWEAAEKAANNALARVRAGETFDAVAKDVSDSPDADRGGNIMVPSLENLPPFYQAPLKSMKPGDLSSVIRSEHGYHFFLYVSSKDAETLPLEQAEQRISGLLKRVKEEDVLDDYFRPIESNVDRVQIYLEIEKNLPPSLLQEAAPPAQ